MCFPKECAKKIYEIKISRGKQKLYEKNDAGEKRKLFTKYENMKVDQKKIILEVLALLSVLRWATASF